MTKWTEIWPTDRDRYMVYLHLLDPLHASSKEEASPYPLGNERKRFVPKLLKVGTLDPTLLFMINYPITLVWYWLEHP